MLKVAAAVLIVTNSGFTSAGKGDSISITPFFDDPIRGTAMEQCLAVRDIVLDDTRRGLFGEWKLDEVLNAVCREK